MALDRQSGRRFARLIRGLLIAHHYERPVFVIGAARSGTTLLYKLLCGALAGLPGEGRFVWDLCHHPRWTGWNSCAVDSGQVRFGERRWVNAYFYAHVGRQRFVEKNPQNAFRVPYLLDLFPDARFIVIKRNPCNVINSLINGWLHPVAWFKEYKVPVKLRIPGYASDRRWCFALFEGWREYVEAPVEEIAYAQWEHYTRAITKARDRVPSVQWHELHLEDLLSHPHETTAEVCRKIDVPFSARLKTHLRDLVAHPVNTMTMPGERVGSSGDDKWRSENAGLIEPLLPRIAANAMAAGYRVDAETGAFQLLRTRPTGDRQPV